MLKTNTLHELQTIRESDYSFENPNDDIRGYTVQDSTGEKIGKIDRLFIDNEAHKVRFIQVGHGGFLGLGREHSLLPVDAIESVDYTDHMAYIQQTREHVGASPAYQPNLVEKPEYYASIYDYYGYPAYWSTGYIYPDYASLHSRKTPEAEAKNK
ncbi:MAG: PRC-barrel domain-containing protein [Thermaceae bacterium]|nr:PRC-barrel domain-containing protein [Thermaceae bacterium]